ncbi:oxidoreductase [Siphonobacter sp. BAB-5385]|uniref:Gfo/Idh/MocA family protein n=1 Tax=unclassified Siphonobacter TaxID=2635712 RepID=UPI000B9ECC0D|nr:MULTISPECIES: Gfo/Idh/MocA family oxidoreductase [unclassified Siphonobacter]OZI10007.1 oxidoreductase [Siphonobacter sp. BAB-5385]PMD93566.1 oxidoreductase [Siphonobacter sp. BAB-5405]
MEKKSPSRREFLKKGALSAAAFYIVPRHVLGKGFIAPSDKLNLASIGAGGKGASDIWNAYNNGAENVVALCDVDWNVAAQSVKRFPNAKRYQNYREMLDKEGKNIDAITISTPDNTHAVIAMAAMQAGKHVYVQKPLSHDIYEARMMTEAARKYKIVSQMGNQGASSVGSWQMVNWFNAGLIGTVNEVHIWTNRPVWPQGIPVPTGKHEMPEGLAWDQFIGPAQYVDYTPAYHPFKWRGWWNFGTGALGDMGCHLIDPAFRVLGLGYPTEVECSAGAVFTKDWTPEYIPEGCPPSSSVQLKFPETKKNKSAVTMYWSDGGIRAFHPDLIPADEPLGDADSANGVILMGSKGIMTCGTYGHAPKLYFNKKKMSEQDLAKYKWTETEIQKMPESGHQTSWVRACKEGFGSETHKKLTSSFDYSGPLTETVLMGNLAIRSYNVRKPNADGKGFAYPGRKKLLWDGPSMRITNFEDANQFVKREYRSGWSLGS